MRFGTGTSEPKKATMCINIMRVIFVVVVVFGVGEERHIFGFYFHWEIQYII